MLIPLCLTVSANHTPPSLLRMGVVLLSGCCASLCKETGYAVFPLVALEAVYGWARHRSSGMRAVWTIVGSIVAAVGMLAWRQVSA